jgi:hypothetical protein
MVTAIPIATNSVARIQRRLNMSANEKPLIFPEETAWT